MNVYMDVSGDMGGGGGGGGGGKDHLGNVIKRKAEPPTCTCTCTYTCRCNKESSFEKATCTSYA